MHCRAARLSPGAPRLTRKAALRRREWKAGGKTDKSLKKKLKRLKSELEGRSGGVSAAEGESKSSSSGGKKRKADAAVGVESGQKRPRANNESGDAQTPSAKVHMGNLNYAITDQDISEFFQGYGEIQEVFWICNKHTQRFSGMGFITFDSVNNAKRAVDEKHETECMGRRIKLNFAREYKERPERQDRGPKLRPVKPLSERPAEPYTVFIGNLSYDVTDESMTSYAEEKAGEGTVSAVRWITDRDSGEFKGAGYIDFATTDAVDAFVTLNGAVWMGRQLRVDYAVPKY